MRNFDQVRVQLRTDIESLYPKRRLFLTAHLLCCERWLAIKMGDRRPRRRSRLMAFPLPLENSLRDYCLPLHSQEKCGGLRSSRKLGYLVIWPALLWMTAMMTTDIQCAIPLLIPEDHDPDIMLVWNVSYVTMSPLGKPQQVRLPYSVYIDLLAWEIEACQFKQKLHLILQVTMMR